MSDNRNRELTVLLLTATALGVADSLIPRPLPFMKPGLANIASVLAVFRYGLLRTLELNLLRVFAVALITGLLATPSFLLSLSGAVASAVIMWLFIVIFGSRLSIVGVSAAGATGSLWAQLSVAGIILPGLPLRNMVLLLTLWGVVSGAAVGFMAFKASSWFPSGEALRTVQR